MADVSKFDLVVIGSGPGGYVAAIRAAQLGMSVALVERSLPLGGTCLNIGCIPSKALLDSSELFQKTRDELGAHGITAGKVTLDLATMMKRKAAVVEKLTSGVSSLMKLNKIQVFEGTGSLTGAGKLSVKNKKGVTIDVAAERIILATGSVPVELPFLKYDGKTVVSSTEALSFEKIPETLAIVGAGAIGLELGSVWNRLGSKVSFVELMPSILPGWDTQLSKTLLRELKKQGMEFHLSARVTGFERQGKGNGILLAEGEKGEKVQVPAEKVLVAVGRRPFSEGLGLDVLPVRRDDRTGRVAVNERYETSVPGIYAIGDLIQGPMLAHKAEDEGIAVVELIAGIHGHVNYDVIPGVVYTWPEAATVGRSEESLKADGVPYRKGSFPFGINGRAIAMDATAGFVKILAHQQTDRILGVHIVGPWASDLVSEAVIAMEFSASAEDLARTVHAHPTLSEVTREAALAVDGRAIHSK